jgi:hypothetical protein
MDLIAIEDLRTRKRRCLAGADGFSVELLLGHPPMIEVALDDDLTAPIVPLPEDRAADATLGNVGCAEVEAQGKSAGIVDIV